MTALVLTWKAEAAWSADLTANPATWVWTDISAFVNGPFTVTRGRRPSSSQSDPAVCGPIRLQNTDSRFTPRHPSSPYWPNVTIGTPIRVTGTSLRFQGYIATLKPVWPAGNSLYAEVVVTATGVMDRLGQGPVLQSAPVRFLKQQAAVVPPVAAWSMEDGPSSPGGAPLYGASPLTPFVGTHPSGAVVSYPIFGSGALAPWLPPVVTLSANAGLAILGASVVMPATSTWSVDYAFSSGTAAADTFVDINPSYLGGAPGWPQLNLDPPNEAVAVSFNGEPEVITTVRRMFNAQPHHIRLTASQSSTKVAWELDVDGVAVQTGITTGAMTLPVINTIGLVQAAGSSPVAQGYLSVWTTPPTLANAAAAIQGWSGETDGARVLRLCGEEGLVAVINGGTVERMGPQKPAKLLDLLRECESTAVGFLCDGLGPGITYTGRDARENRAVALTLNAANAHVKLPFEPVEDNTRIINDATASRTYGQVGPGFVDSASVAAKGHFPATPTVNTFSDIVLHDHESWTVHEAGVEEMRVPGVEISLTDRPELIPFWAAADLGIRYTVFNLPAQYPPPFSTDQILDWYSETFEGINWTASLVGSPFLPWRIFTAAATTGDTTEFVGHADTDDSALNAGITATATSIVVKTNSGPLWTTTADDFPFDIGIAGEQIRVTNITGSSSPQTFTVVRSVNQVSKAHLINDPVSLWAPMVLGL